MIAKVWVVRRIDEGRSKCAGVDQEVHASKRKK
jgi:hypothetical protein